MSDPEHPEGDETVVGDSAAASHDRASGAGLSDGSSYRLGATLGEGGMAVVYEASDQSLDRTVAVKFLRDELANRPEMRERFVDEARILGRLAHPGVVPVYEAGRTADRRLFYSMKRVRGQTLHRMLNARGYDELRDRASITRFVDLFLKICETMAAAHADDIIHRDLKPDNVMVDDFGAVYVMDWGIAKQLTREQDGRVSDSSRTRVGVVMGTPDYMAPELASGQSDQSDRQTDVFSLGIILYEILTGTNPFRTGDARQSMKGILHHDPPEPRKVNRPAGRTLSAICMKALSKDPFRRYESARELGDDIRAFREARAVSAIEPRLIDRISRWARRRPAAAASLGTLLVVVVLAGVAVGYQAAVERALVEDLYGVIDRIERNQARVEEGLAEIRLSLGDPTLSDEERASMTAVARSLDSLRETQSAMIRGMAYGITGLTIVSPERRSQEILRRDHLESIDSAIEDEDLLNAAVLIRWALGSYERENYLGLTPEQAARLELQMEQVREGIEARGWTPLVERIDWLDPMVEP